MGDIADYLIQQQMDNGWFDDSDSGYVARRSCRRSRKIEPENPQTFSEEVRAVEFPSKKTDPKLLRDYPEKTFDMSFFPTVPKKKKPDVWDADPEEAPF